MKARLVAVVLGALALAALRSPAQVRAQRIDPPRALGLDLALRFVVEDPEVWIDGRRPKRTIDREVDRAGMLDSAVKVALASGRPVFWYIPRIVESSSRGRQMYRAPVLDLYAQHVFFNDPDLVDLLTTRFVPVRLACDDALAERFDVRPLETVEPAFVVLSGEGEVLHLCERIRTFDPVWLYEQLRMALELLPEAEDKVQRGTVERLLAEGRHEAAAKLIAVMEPSGRRSYLAAILARRTRDGELAQSQLVEAESLGGVPPGDLAAEHNRLALLLGEPGRAVAPSPASFGARTAEAVYLAGLAAYAQHDNEAAAGLLQRVDTEYPDTIWGRRARANTTFGPDARPYGPLGCGFEQLRWLPEANYSALARDTVARESEPPALGVVVRRAVDNLLLLQRKNGGFEDSRYAYWSSPKITPNTWVAITALAASALLAHRDVAPARIDRAVAAAERYLFDPAKLNRGENEDVYADTYRLLFLARRSAIEEDDAVRADLIAKMEQIIAAAAERQAEDGFFAHEYRNAFCTGAMLWGLELARRAGAAVPESMSSRGTAALVAARTEEGGFAYGGTAERRKSSIKDSSARMPLCEGSLFIAGASDEKRLVAAFDAYWTHIDRIEQVRRNDFHSDGELGGFFFFHGLFHSTEMAAVLPADAAAEHAQKALDLVRRIREIDGSFLDSHEIGRSYGTAMGLLTIDSAQALIHR